jgi:hypothetical protein
MPLLPPPPPKDPKDVLRSPNAANGEGVGAVCDGVGSLMVEEPPKEKVGVVVELPGGFMFKNEFPKPEDGVDDVATDPNPELDP